jgi:hypothetical protein
VCIADIMELEFDGKKRETLLDPMIKKIDANGKVYLDKKRAGEQVLIIPLKTIPGDKEKWVKIGRS